MTMRATELCEPGSSFDPNMEDFSSREKELTGQCPRFPVENLRPYFRFIRRQHGID